MAIKYLPDHCYPKIKFNHSLGQTGFETEELSGIDMVILSPFASTRYNGC